MAWVGVWKNQYGSTLTVADDADGKIVGTFRTALRDSGFYGKEIAVSGIHLGDCINFAFAAATESGDLLCSFSGLLRDGRIETVWHVLADGRREEDGRMTKRNWPHAVMTNADTFTRVE